MTSLLEGVRPLLGSLFVFSFVMNLLFIVPSLFMLQVFDRVLPSNSRETLLVLLAGTAVALLILFVLDCVRNRLQHVAGAILDERLSPPVVKAIVARSARAPHSSGPESVRAAAPTPPGPLPPPVVKPIVARSARAPHSMGPEGVRDVAALRAVFSANGLIALFDAPWVIVYGAVIWGCHPALGLGAAIAAVVMLALAGLNDLVSRRGLDNLQREGRRAAHYVETSLRNAEVLQALGMTKHLLARWRALQDQISATQTRASRRGVFFTAVTRFLRQAIQILMMALGAYLVLTQQASAGVMIATTVLLGRAVQPVEQLVGSWRMLSDARSAYFRLRDLSKDFDRGTPRVSLPAPDGRLVADGVSFRLRSSEQAILTNIAFS